MFRPNLLLCALLAVCACGSSGSDVDAAESTDAPESSVKVVTCPGTPDSVVTTAGFAYSISRATVPVNGIVHFTMEATHDAKSTSAAAAPFHVDFGADVCLQFTLAGTYPFVCTAHGFTGALAVQ